MQVRVRRFVTQPEVHAHLLTGGEVAEDEPYAFRGASRAIEAAAGPGKHLQREHPLHKPTRNAEWRGDTVGEEAEDDVSRVRPMSGLRASVDVDVAPGGLDVLAAEGEVVEVATKGRYPAVGTLSIRGLERPCDIVRLPGGNLQLKLACRVEEQA